LVAAGPDPVQIFDLRRRRAAIACGGGSCMLSRNCRAGRIAGSAESARRKGGTPVHTVTRRSILLGAVAAPFVARARTASAQSWPTSTVRIVVPFPAGGSVDAIARIAQNGLQQRLGATIIIENKPGGSGSIGTGMVAKSPPDGGTFLFVFDTHAVNPSLISNLPFDNDRDLDPVMLIATAPYVVACHPSRPFKSLADLIAAAKAKPGTISYGSVGSGSVGHLAMVLLDKLAGIELVHVPYRGGGPAMNDVVAGHIDLINGSAALLSAQIQAGAIRPIFQMGQTRLPNLAEVGTVGESGFAGAQASTWWGAFAPAGTPKPIVERFGTALRESLREERVARQLIETQQMNLRLGGPDELRTFANEQARIWGAVVRENNIKGDV
jgi:tripartite-type tricarboxylate transporter receptor subunit TctC